MRRVITFTSLALLACVMVAESLGVRAHVGALSGTLPATDVELVVGMAYVAAYFASTIFVPIWFLALILDAAYGRLRTWTSRAR